MLESTGKLLTSTLPKRRGQGHTSAVTAGFPVCAFEFVCMHGCVYAI